MTALSDSLPPIRPTIATLRLKFRFARKAVFAFSTESAEIWSGARAAYNALPFEKRAEYLRALESDLSPYLALPALLEKAKRDRIRKIAASTKGPIK